MDSRIFFLGGHDGEMIEIRNLLKARGCPYFDEQPAWGAALSRYNHEIKNLPVNAIPVLIELNIDVPPPENAIIIDHHNEKAGREKKSSLEQVAGLLNITLDRRQMLISANDKGYIPAMKSMGATEEEIQSIRGYDRKAQGVTDEDERLAVISIERNLTKPFEDTAVVESKTNKTSPVFDRLYNKYLHVFIYTPDGEINYSGTGDMVLAINHFYKNAYIHKIGINAADAVTWYGGDLPRAGFWGAEKAIMKKDLINFLKQKGG